MEFFRLLRFTEDRKKEYTIYGNTIETRSHRSGKEE